MARKPRPQSQPNETAVADEAAASTPNQPTEKGPKRTERPGGIVTLDF